MNTEAERKAFRRKLEDLTETELTQWMFLANLALKVETELQCYRALWGPSSELDPPPDGQLAIVQVLLANEIRRRSGAKAKLQTVPIDTTTTEGEHANHANHAENGSH